MKVRPNQSSGIPVPAQESESIKDGTSNTLQSAESSRPEKPFAKDGFESPRFEKAGFPMLDGSSKDAAFRGEASVTKSPRDAASGLKSDSNEVAVETLEAREAVKGKIPRGEATMSKVQNEIDIETKKLELRDEKVIEDLNVKYTLFLPEE